MGIDGCQWDIMQFHGLIKPFQGAEFRGFHSIASGFKRASRRRTDAAPACRFITSGIRRLEFGGFVASARWFCGAFRANPEQIVTICVDEFASYQEKKKPDGL